MSVTSYNVGRLQKWLDYELSGMSLFILSYLYRVTLYLAVIAAVIFIPILFKVLFEERRYGWVITFFLLVVIPPLVTYSILDESIRLFVAGCVALGLFYFYCGLLRLIIPEWED